MTIGRRGKNFRSRAAKNGCAAWLTPAQVNTPPCSSRRARDCTAGAFEMSANKLLVADAAAFCAKQRQVRSGKRNRQAGGVNQKPHAASRRRRWPKLPPSIPSGAKMILGAGGHDWFKDRSLRFYADKLPNRFRECPGHNAPPIRAPKTYTVWLAKGCRPSRRVCSWSDRSPTN